MFGRRKKEKKEQIEKSYTENEIEMFDNTITTPIDRLFELVMKKGKIRIKDAAKNFSVNKTQIEEWAKILEDHNLIEIHYPPIGESELRKMTLGKDESKKKPKEKPGG